MFNKKGDQTIIILCSIIQDYQSSQTLLRLEVSANRIMLALFQRQLQWRGQQQMMEAIRQALNLTS